MKPEKLATLVLDIETAPMEAYIWNRDKQYIGTDKIKKDWHLMAWAAKWLDDPVKAVMYMDQRKAKDITNDKGILFPLWNLLDRADIVITQNGKAFDGPKLNARFILNGMKPPSPYRHLDTYLIAKGVADFTANSLEYLSEKLCTKYKKLHHSKYPGLSLWLECIKGNTDAWDEMKKYNIHDVLATEELYHRLKAWAPEKSPDIYRGPKGTICGACGSTEVIKWGVWASNTGIRQRHLCKGCGRWLKGDKLK